MYFFSVGQIGRYLASVWRTSFSILCDHSGGFPLHEHQEPTGIWAIQCTHMCVYAHTCLQVEEGASKTDWAKLGRKVVRNPFLKVTTAS